MTSKPYPRGARVRRSLRKQAQAARTSHSESGPGLPEARETGFWLGLRFAPGQTERAGIQVLRRLEDHVHDHGLRIAGGTQQHLFLQATDMELGLTDRIDVLDWCLHHTPAVQLAVSSPTEVSLRLPLTSSVLRIHRWDLATHSVSLLYQMRRIGAEQYAQILGGFVADGRGELFA